MTRNDERDHRFLEILEVLRRHRAIRGMTPPKLRLILEDLGPTFVKLGQIMSMRPDMLPPAYCEELRKLRADVKPMTAEEAAAVVEKEYGKPLYEVFLRFDPVPLGSASIAQVHCAELKSGEKVVVKIRRPGIRGVMARDIAMLRRASGFLRIAGGTGDAIDFNQVIGELWTAAKREMDFEAEARQAEEFRRLNAGVKYFACPRVFPEYSAASVLVMEYMEGIPIDSVDQLSEEGYDLNEIGLKLAENYIKQVVDDGFFHADPHPGNLRIQEGKIVWLDMGMMGRLNSRDRRIFRDLINAAACGDINEMEDLLLALCEPSAPVNHALLYTDLDQLLNKYSTLDIGNMNLLKIRDDLLGLAKRHGLTLPPGVSMLGRGLITLEGVISTVSPEINMMQVMVNHISGNLLRQFDLSAELRKIGLTFFRSGRRAPNIPAQVSELLKMGIKGQTKANVEVAGIERQFRALLKIADRLVLALIDAGLLIGSAMICSSRLPACNLGIPPLAVAGLVFAAVLTAYLLWAVFFSKDL